MVISYQFLSAWFEKWFLQLIDIANFSVSIYDEIQVQLKNVIYLE